MWALLAGGFPGSAPAGVNCAPRPCALHILRIRDPLRGSTQGKNPPISGASRVTACPTVTIRRWPAAALNDEGTGQGQQTSQVLSLPDLEATGRTGPEGACRSPGDSLDQLSQLPPGPWPPSSSCHLPSGEQTPRNAFSYPPFQYSLYLYLCTGPACTYTPRPTFTPPFSLKQETLEASTGAYRAMKERRAPSGEAPRGRTHRLGLRTPSEPGPAATGAQQPCLGCSGRFEPLRILAWALHAPVRMCPLCKPCHHTEALLKLPGATQGRALWQPPLGSSSASA